MTDGIIVDKFFLTDKISNDYKEFSECLPSQCEMINDICIIKGTDMAKAKRIPNGIALVKMWSNNYFQFMFESMSKLGEIEKLNEYKDWLLIIDECVSYDPKSPEIIELLNVNERKVVWIKRCELIKVDKLLVPPH